MIPGIRGNLFPRNKVGTRKQRHGAEANNFTANTCAGANTSHTVVVKKKKTLGIQLQTEACPTIRNFSNSDQVFKKLYRHYKNRVAQLNPPRKYSLIIHYSFGMLIYFSIVLVKLEKFYIGYTNKVMERVSTYLNRGWIHSLC
jgi:predicted GIY-YIG superfamily endonuclease